MADDGAGRDCRVCIQTKRVYDAAIKKIPLTNAPVAVRNVSIASPVLPLRFLGARSTVARAILTGLNAERLPEGLNRNEARVTATVTIPLEVRFADGENNAGRGDSSLSINIDVIMTLPRQSIMPYEVEVVASAASTIGVFVGTTVINGEVLYLFSIECCVTIIIKIVAEVEMIIQSLGYCCLPEARDYGEAVCEGFFGLPLFPD